MQKISVGACLRFGWETFKKRPLFLIGLTFGYGVIQVVIGALPEQQGIMAVLLGLALLIINTLIDMGILSAALKAHADITHLSTHDMWHPKLFWKYLGVKILQWIIIFVGIILLVIPGIIAGIVFMLATYLVLDRNLAPIEALKESARLTKGNRWNLFLLFLAIVGLNILGAVAFLVGLLVSLPVTLLALTHAYRTLAAKGAAPVSE
jgi:uncharacterized membrane protein